ncbi:MAG: hypothetical protein ABJN36_18700 [Cyclobacteriaceae bacterium]
MQVHHSRSLILYILLLAIACLSPFAGRGQDIQPDNNQYHACFFEKHSFTLGAGLSLEPGKKGLGTNGRLYYNIRENICFGPEVTYEEKGKSTETEINLVFHYIFEVFHFGIYPVVGAGISNEKNSKHGEHNFIALAGVGVHRNWNRLTFFSELDFSIYEEESTMVFGLMLTP